MQICSGEIQDRSARYADGASFVLFAEDAPAGKIFGSLGSQLYRLTLTSFSIMPAHRVWARRATQLIAAWAFFFVLVLQTPTCVHRNAFDRAFGAWYKDPNPKSLAVLQREAHLNHVISDVAAAGLALVMALVGCGGYWSLRQIDNETGCRST
jgi:hypothetical protein